MEKSNSLLIILVILGLWALQALTSSCSKESKDIVLEVNRDAEGYYNLKTKSFAYDGLDEKELEDILIKIATDTVK